LRPRSSIDELSRAGHERGLRCPALPFPRRRTVPIRKLTLAAGAAVQTAGIAAANGVVHTVDRALLPPARR
jgi:hypothetical protein